jgi:hypothetical protein
MKSDTLFTKVAASMGTVALALTLSACSSSTKVTQGQDYGQIRTEQAAMQQPVPPDQVIATAPAPKNAQGVEAPAAPAVIPGPAKVDETGRVYTSSSVGSAGNASATGLNTNVNIIPKKTSSTVVVTETPAPVETAVVVETPPAAVVIETPAPAPVVVETTTPMTSSTTETTTHRRMRKD